MQSLGAIPFDLVEFRVFFSLSRRPSLPASSSVRCSRFLSDPAEQSCGRREQDGHPARECGSHHPISDINDILAGCSC